jgi:hypothetical protein
MWPCHVCQICAIHVEHNPPSFSSKFLQLLPSFQHILFLIVGIIGIPRGTSFDKTYSLCFLHPMSLMWLVLSILPPTYMEKEKGKKTLSKSKN